MYYVYLATNKVNTVVYTGVTNNLIRRIFQHKNSFAAGFTQRYNVTKLVYYEEYTDINEALNREKQIKGGSRKKKINLVLRINPNFEDLYEKLLA